jgi:hypothetical protein
VSLSIKEKYQFLYDNANPIVKNEAAAMLGLENAELRRKMLASADVQYWIDRLHHFIKKPQVHNADDHCLENSMHKLVSFGIKEIDDIRIQEANKFILDHLQQNSENPDFFNSVNQTIAASWLAYMGYEDKIINDILLERINKVYEFTKEKKYDIYIRPNGYPAIPTSRKMHQFVNPALYENNIWRLPPVHDIFAYSNLPKKLAKNSDLLKKIDIIIEYIIDAKYQKLYPGYGLMLVPPNKYYSMGWSVHLSGYKKDDPPGLSGLLWCMELLSKFTKARETKWFKRNLQHLSKYECNGIYSFPKEYLNESKRKYYVGGGHMGLGEDRKNKLWNKIESTAWMLRITNDE